MNKEIYDLVITLNDMLYASGLDKKLGWYYSYQGNEVFDSLKFNDEVIWDTQDRGKEWNEETSDYESWKSFLIKDLTTKIDNLIDLRELINGTLEDN